MLRFTGQVVTSNVERLQRPPVAPSRLPWAASGVCDVETLLVWAVCEQRIGRQDETRGLLRVEAEAMGLEWRAASTDGCAAVAAIGGLGCKIDVSRGSGPAREHPVAAMVGEVIEASPHGGLLFDYAQAAARPDGWRAPHRWVRPEHWVVQDAEAVAVFAGRRNGPRYCPVILAYDEAAMAAGRAGYSRWRDALAEVAWLLALRPLGFVVSGPACAAEPWVGLDSRLQV